jgi:hypothetical protein
MEQQHNWFNERFIITTKLIAVGQTCTRQRANSTKTTITQLQFAAEYKRE